MTEIEITGIDRDEGSVVVFIGTMIETGTPVLVAVDHRPAQDIAEALSWGDAPIVLAPSWAILGGS